MAACQGQQLIVIAALGSLTPQPLVVIHGAQKVRQAFAAHQPCSACAST